MVWSGHYLAAHTKHLLHACYLRGPAEGLLGNTSLKLQNSELVPNPPESPYMSHKDTWHLNSVTVKLAQWHQMAVSYLETSGNQARWCVQSITGFVILCWVLIWKSLFTFTFNSTRFFDCCDPTSAVLHNRVLFTLWFWAGGSVALLYLVNSKTCQYLKDASVKFRRFSYKKIQNISCSSKWIGLWHSQSTDDASAYKLIRKWDGFI